VCAQNRARAADEPESYLATGEMGAKKLCDRNPAQKRCDTVQTVMVFVRFAVKKEEFSSSILD